MEWRRRESNPRKVPAVALRVPVQLRAIVSVESVTAGLR